jgi:hypothetical protein
MTLLNTIEARTEDPFDPPMKAVILYDTVDFAVKAASMLTHATRRANQATYWHVAPWRMDVLRLPPAAEAALTEAAAAHLIVLPARGTQILAAWLVEWLERWATNRQVKEAALAVCDADDDPLRAAVPTSALAQFAARHGVSVISREPVAAEA